MKYLVLPGGFFIEGTYATKGDVIYPPGSINPNDCGAAEYRGWYMICGNLFDGYFLKQGYQIGDIVEVGEVCSNDEFLELEDDD